MRGPITQSSTNPLQYTMTMTWTPPASAWGTYFFCISHMNKRTYSSTRNVLQITVDETVSVQKISTRGGTLGKLNKL